MKETETCSCFNRSIAIFKLSSFIAAAVAMLSLSPGGVQACGCGCGAFSVGTSSLLPTHEGGWFFLEYDFMDQNKNWSNTSSAPLANNADNDIKTHFFDVGMQYMFGRSWGIRAEVPFWKRHFATLDGWTDEVVGFDHTALGDMRIKGIYSGLSPDMSSGITFGLKLPTGDYKYANFDRDTEIGTGSTDFLLGAYHTDNLAGMWNWYVNGEAQQPFAFNGGYHPGGELNMVLGVYYGGWKLGRFTIAPVAQAIGSGHLHDRGPLSNPGDSGYERVLLSPGLETDISNLRFYVEAAFPVYQHVRGNQLVASALYKANVSFSF